MKIFVGGLAWSTTDASLRAAFEHYGPVTEATVVKDKETGRSRGFGFVSFASREHGQVALEKMNGATLDGRTIRCDEAVDRPGRGPRSDGPPRGPQQGFDRGPPRRFDDRGPPRPDDRGPPPRRFEDRGPPRPDDRGPPPRRFEDAGPPPRRFEDAGPPPRRFEDSGPPPRRFDNPPARPSPTEEERRRKKGKARRDREGAPEERANQAAKGPKKGRREDLFYDEDDGYGDE